MRELWASAFLLLLIGCVTDPVNTDAGPGQGMRGGPCAPMMQCFSGLTCLDGTCVQLPDSGTSTDGSMPADSGADAMMCNLPHPAIGSNCSGSEVACLLSNMVTCQPSETMCFGGTGRVFKCRSGATCSNPCCLDPMVMPAGTATCPQHFNFQAAGMYVTNCGAPGCPNEVCASDADCQDNMGKPHCRAATFDSTTIQFGVCAP